MKRFLAVLIVLSVVFACFTNAVAELVTYTPAMTNGLMESLGVSSTDVISNSFLRAAVTVLLWWDLGDTGNYDGDLGNDFTLADSYVGINDDGRLNVCILYGNTCIYNIMYNYRSQGSKAVGGFYDFGYDISGSMDTVVPLFCSAGRIKEYYKNTASDLLAVLNLMADNL